MFEKTTVHQLHLVELVELVAEPETCMAHIYVYVCMCIYIYIMSYFQVNHGQYLVGGP